MTSMDRVSEIATSWMMALGPMAIRLILQLDELVLLPIIFTAVGYFLALKAAAAAQTSPSPNVAVQSFLGGAGLLAAIRLPVPNLNIYDPTGRLWLIMISIFLWTVGVRGLVFLLGLQANHQKSVTWGMYITMFVLCLWQLFQGGFRQ